MATSMEASTDTVTSGYLFALTLEELSPMAALHLAATAALSDSEDTRASVAEALSWIFPLVGDDVVLDHLASDPSVRVRFAVARAAHARRCTLGDALLHRLLVDPAPRVAGTAAFALMPRAREVVAGAGP